MPSCPLLTCDVFLLCFSISSPASLYSAVDHWLPLLQALAPTTPAVLVGCKADLRSSARLQVIAWSSQSALTPLLSAPGDC